MRQKRVVAGPLFAVIFVLVSLLGWHAFAGTAPPRAPAGSLEPPGGRGGGDEALIFEAAPRVRRIGAPGVFQLRLDLPPEAVSRAFLTYELAGLPHWSAAVRSINGLPAGGGFGAAATSGTVLQIEEINPRWLRLGVNEVLFLPVPGDEPLPRGISSLREKAALDPVAEAGGTIPYTVRNLRLVLVADGAPSPAPRLRLTHPVKGEQGAEGAYVAGFVEPAVTPAGPPELFVGGVHVPGGVSPADGSFAVFAPRAAAVGEPWEVEVEVVFPDGTRLRQTVRLREVPGDGDTEEKAEADARPGESKALGLGKARLDVSADALGAPVKLTMRRLRKDELPALDAGMTNVTPLAGGVRMGPHGLRFKKAVRLTLPYDPALIPKGMTEDEILTFFFDEETGRWVPLPRLKAEAGEQVVVSLTDHFTDFINATLAIPDEPSGANFSPNSLGELAKADPASQIVQIEPPDGGPMGDAMLDLPIVVPPGRHGLQPDLAVHYDSGGGNGWMGLGWNLRLPSIEVHTAFGVPRYDPAKETETYLLNGEQLSPLADPGRDRVADRLFNLRVEGSFQRIVRRGSGPGNFWWEVTDQNGVRSQFGRTAQARLSDPVSGNVFRWGLERVIDLHGNTVDYTYATDSGGGGEAGEPWVELYPQSITYTGGPGVAGFYQVTFALDDGEQRPDRMSSGRQGFKTVTRRRLAAVDVLAGGSLVRRYLFQYREGDFRKTLLQSVAVTGEDGQIELYRHGFGYVPMPVEADGYAGFGAPQAWGGIRGGQDSTGSFRIGGGAHAFAGLGPPACQPHFGVQLGGSGTDTTQRVSFLDVNGDGLPDRVDDDGDVDLNLYDPAADPDLTGPGRFEQTRFPGLDALGHTTEWSLDFGVGVHSELGVPASLDATWAWLHSNDDRVVADVNGDHFLDLVSTADGFAVRLNDGRSFTPRSTWGGFGSGGLNLSAPGEETEVLTSFTLADALRQLVLPYSGRVTVQGAVQKKLAGGDGVTAALYHGGTRLWSHRFEANDTAACEPGPGDACGGGLSFDVQAGDSLYFLAASVRETSADALLWAPVVTYEGRDATAREPSGARTFVFAAAEDFHLAGYFGAAWSAPAGGTVRLLGPVTKQETSDDVDLTISRSRNGNEETVYSRRLVAAEVGTFDEIPPIEVQAGDVLFLRLASDTPVGPNGVRWNPTAAFEGDTVPPSLPDSLRSQPARVSIAAPRLGPLNRPLESWSAPGAGEQTVLVDWSPPGPFQAAARSTLYVQGVNRLIAKLPLPAAPDSFTVTVTAAAGEPLFFTQVAETPEDAGTLTAGGGDIPVNLRYRSGDGVSIVLSGGYHGWFYGDWNGNVAFHPAGLVPPTDEGSTAHYVPGVPSWEGVEGFAEPVWKAAGFDLYLAAEGAKPSRQGANAAGVLDQSSGRTPGEGLSILRKTTGRTAGVGANAGVGLSFSQGETETQLDLLDMNGDLYPDQVASGGVRFSNGRDGFLPFQGFGGLDSAVRRVEDGTASTAIGLGLNFVKKNGKGKPTAVASTLPSAGSTVSLSQTPYDLIDVNGDGLPDRVSMAPGSGAAQVRLNLGYRFGAPETWDLPRWDGNASSRCEDVIDSLGSKLGQLSGLNTLDGLSFTRSSALHAGASFGPFGASAVTTLARTLVEMIDVNGDGLPDHVTKEQGVDFFRVKLNLGDRWDPEQRWYVPGWSTSIGDGYNPFGIFQCLDAVSFNGNVEGQGSAGAPICIPLIPPIPVVGLQIELSGQVFGGQGGLQLLMEDLDGDGFADHVLKKAGDPNVYVKRNRADKVNLLSAVHRPLGSTIGIQYERRGNHADMPFSQWVLSGVTVDDGRGNVYPTRYEYGNDAFYDRGERESYGYPHVRAVLPDGSTVDRTFHNRSLYSRYLMTREVTADAAGNLFRVETLEYEERPVGDTGAARFPALVAETTAFYEGTATSEGAAPKSTRMTYDYDAAGNVIRTVDFADVGADDDLVASVSYHVDPAAHVFKPQLLEVRDGAGRLLRQRRGSFDEFGDLVRLEATLIGGRDPETGSPYTGARNAIRTYSYDALGNLASSVDPTGYTSTFAWDPETGTYPVQVRDSFGYTTRHGYHLKYGTLAETIDENGSALRSTYDLFGRLIRVVGPYDSDAEPALAFEYAPGAPISSAVVHHKDVTRGDALDTAVFIDSLGRTLQVREDADLDLGIGTSTRTGVRVSGRVEFDAKGRVASQAQPVFDDGPAHRFLDAPGKNSTAFTYDVLDRVREVRFPHGAVTHVDYGFGTLDGADRLLTTRTDPNGRATRFYRDVQGDVLGVEQSNVYGGIRKTLVTRYAYDALSQLTSVADPKGNTTRLEYDTLGRNVVLDNPDLGRTEYRYDPAGNLGAKITANLAAAGKQIRYLHTFNRLDRIDYPGMPDAVYTYGGPGAPENRANRVATVTDESGVEERSYDKLGDVVRTVKTATALNGNSPRGPYVTASRFDSFGRLLAVTYPDGEELTYGYDASGQVKSAAGVLQGVRFDYLRHQGYDEFGHRARVVYGNGVETRYTYDPRSRFLAQLRTTGAGRDLQNLRYEHDLAGSIQAIHNEVPVPGSSLPGGPTSQTFRYDDLYQLVAAEGSFQSAPNKQSIYALTLSYDETGNVTAKRQLHQTVNGGGNPKEEKKTSFDWAYTYGGPQPHAPTHIGDRTFRYDLNGNQAGWDHDRNGTRRNAVWDEENRLKSMADNGQTTRFLYGAAGQRTNKAGQHGETVYVNRWFSIRNGAIASKHVFADDIRLTTKVSPSANPSSEKVYFYQPNHLGSAHFITDDQGAVYQHLEYFPSGEIWVDDRSETQRTPFLFSGKELDEETGLSYFGARYYDSRQGQWISADPVLDGLIDVGDLAEPGLSVSPYRQPGDLYAYVGNDPVDLIDPEGFGKFLSVELTDDGVVEETWDVSEIMERYPDTWRDHVADIYLKAAKANAGVQKLNLAGTKVLTSVGSKKVKTATQQWITAFWEGKYGPRPKSSRAALNKIRPREDPQDVDEFLTRVQGGLTILQGDAENQGPLLAFVNQTHGAAMGQLANSGSVREITGFRVKLVAAPPRAAKYAVKAASSANYSGPPD